LRIEIDIPRPFITLALIGGVLFFLWPKGGENLAGSAVGGSDASAVPAVILATEDNARRLRIERRVLESRVEILRYQIEVLEEERVRAYREDPALESQIKAAMHELIELLQDQRAAEMELKETLMELWDAQGIARRASLGSIPTGILLVWPVEPELGISARFQDAAYEERFGLPHEGVDIPLEQGSHVYAAHDGIVVDATDHGMGFNAVVLKDARGFTTLYGHVSKLLVSAGQRVRAGELLALSGGMPRTPGAGKLTTGPHVHFELRVNGEALDPLPYLESGEKM
jgi:murein DD-endopeptidase MepM/ murein hydrolase activator NlpD